MQGWAPSTLTDRGREQARALGAHLAARYDFDRLVASDLRRTRETTAMVREHGIAPEPTFDRAWRERDFGVYQGLTKTEVFEQYPEFAVTSGVSAVREVPENGESLMEPLLRDGEVVREFDIGAAAERALGDAERTGFGEE
mgnify:CR=1 FL=1